MLAILKPDRDRILLYKCRPVSLHLLKRQTPFLKSEQVYPFFEKTKAGKETSNQYNGKSLSTPKVDTNSPLLIQSDYDDTSRYGSGTTSGAGFGNKTSSGGLGYGDDDDQRTGLRTGSSNDRSAYSGGSAEYGSGTTGGAGFGNKTSSSNRDEYDNSGLRTGSHGDTGAYSGGSERYGSGTTSGAGFGNKTGSFGRSDGGEGKGGEFGLFVSSSRGERERETGRRDGGKERVMRK